MDSNPLGHAELSPDPLPNIEIREGTTPYHPRNPHPLRFESILVKTAARVLLKPDPDSVRPPDHSKSESFLDASNPFAGCPHSL